MKTIREQLTRRLLLSAALLVLVGGVVVYLCARTMLQAQFDAALRARGQAISSLTEPEDGSLELEGSGSHLPGFEPGADQFFELWLAPDTSVMRSGSLGDQHLPSRHGTQESPTFWNLTLPDGRRCRAAGFRFAPRDGRRKRRALEAILVVASVRRDLDRTLAILQIVLGGGGLLLLAATAVVVPRVLRRGLQPLDQLADEAARIDASSLTARFPSDDLPGELVPITAGLNELLARLEDSFERERRFSADVAHEFRTPVAELRTLAELAIKLPDTRTDATDRETLSIALQLESLLQRIQTLSRAERGALPVGSEHVDSEALVRTVCAPFQRRAGKDGLEFKLHVSPVPPVQTDPVLLQAILTNLLNNAMAYAPRGGEVAVELASENDHLAVRVLNTVADLNERDLPHLFERFWRKDAARASDGHSGLGLSLAQSFAHSIGFELHASLVHPARLALILTGPFPRKEGAACINRGNQGARGKAEYLDSDAL